MRDVRPPAVAGTFYPTGPTELGPTVDRLLAEARPPAQSEPPRALVVPHAGYAYCGTVAATRLRRACGPTDGGGSSPSRPSH